MYENVEVFLPIHEGISATQNLPQNQPNQSKFTSQIRIQTKNFESSGSCSESAYSQFSKNDVTKSVTSHSDYATSQSITQHADNLTTDSSSTSNDVPSRSDVMPRSCVVTEFEERIGIDKQNESFMSFQHNLSYGHLCSLPPMHIICTNNSGSGIIAEKPPKGPSRRSRKPNDNLKSRSTTALHERMAALKTAKMDIKPSNSSRSLGLTVASRVSSTSLVDINNATSSQTSSSNQNRLTRQHASSATKLYRRELLIGETTLSKSNLSLPYKEIPICDETESVKQLVANFEKNIQLADDQFGTFPTSKSMNFSTYQEDNKNKMTRSSRSAKSSKSSLWQSNLQ